MEAAAALAGRACAALVGLAELRPLTLLGRVLLAGLALEEEVEQLRRPTMTERTLGMAARVGKVTSYLNFLTRTRSF